MKQFSFTNFPEINSKRLLLRQLNSDDVFAIFKLRTNKEINKLISRKLPNKLEDAAEFIATCHQEFKKQNRIFWAIELKETKEVIGTIVFHNISLENEYAEIGYELNPKFQQKGFMNEAIKEVISFGFNKMKLKTIEAFTHKNNIASITLLEKHLFVFQPERKCKSVIDNRIFKLVNSL